MAESGEGDNLPGVTRLLDQLTLGDGLGGSVPTHTTTAISTPPTTTTTVASDTAASATIPPPAEPVEGQTPQTPEEAVQAALDGQVVLDLETTGLERDCHITQIAAVSPTAEFSAYVMPKKPINARASEITGLSLVDGQLCKEGEPVTTVSIRQALTDLIKMLGDQPVVLLAHNGKRFDFRRLVRAANACGKLEELSDKVAGLVDTLSVFKELRPGLRYYNQGSLYTEYFQRDFTAHDALADVKALRELLDEAAAPTDVLLRHSFFIEDLL